MIVSSEICNPYPFIFERLDGKLFGCITKDMISQRVNLVPNHGLGLHAVTIILPRAAPLTDPYFYFRDQNPAKAKVHREHGFAPLRLAVKLVSFCSIPLS